MLVLQLNNNDPVSLYINEMTKQTKAQIENTLAGQENQGGELSKAQVEALAKQEQQNGELVSDDMMLGIYSEILDDIRKNTEEVDDILANFVDMVINEGDASNASKEALVNLVKIKTDFPTQKARIADLMTRIKLKEKNTMPDWQKAKQNTINIYEGTPGGSTKRALLEEIEKAKGK